MKNLFKGCLTLVALGLSFGSNAQCTVSATPLTSTINCGESVDIVAAGVTSGPVLAENFNAGGFGSGWVSTQTLIYTNPCGPTLDGTPAAWMGSTATQPRELTTIGFDLQCGANICFDLDFAGDENSTDCEDPDASNEGVYFRYSINNGASWVDIFYFQPNSANTGPYYQWANYCFDLPVGGWSNNTMLHWRQDAGSSANWDHWGIDNVTIQPYDCGNAYYYEWDGALGDSDSTMYPTTNTTYNIAFMNGVDDTCYTSVNVIVTPLNVDISANTLVLNCGDCADLTAFLNPVPNNPGANYTYSWTPSATVSSPNTDTTTACPSFSETYQVDVVETNSGCTGSETIDITMNNGTAIAEFTPSVLQGCAPLAVNFNNTSTGVTYVWDFGDGSATDNTTNPSHTFTNPGTYTVQLTAQLPGATCQDSTITIDITVGANITPVANFDYVTECGEATVVFTNTGTPNLTYDWDMGDGGANPDYTTFDATHTFASNGTYTVTLTTFDAACGTTDSYSEVIAIVDNPISLNIGDPTCHQIADGSITVGFNNTGSETVIITDSTGAVLNGGQLSANQLVAGWYYIDVDLGGACQTLDSVYLPDPAIIDVTVDVHDVLCYGDNSGYVLVQTVSGTQGHDSLISYFWNPDLAGINGIGADSSYNMTSGDYTLTVNDSVGCSKTFTFTVNQPTLLEFTDETGADPAYCRMFDYQNGGGRVVASAMGGTPGYDYIWTNLATGAASGNTTWGQLNPGDYEILVQDNNGCIISRIVTVDSLNPIADFDPTSIDFTADWEGTAPVSVTYTNTSSNYLNPLDPSSVGTFIWNLDTTNNQSWVITNDFNLVLDTTFLNGGTYTACLEVINDNGCADLHCKDIIIFDDLIFTPINVFTPNGDFDNDEFTFVYKSFAVKTFNCVVVNRWGVKVAEFTDITASWDGTDFNESVCKDGAYFYTYEGEAENGDLFSGQGTVTLVTGKQ